MLFGPSEACTVIASAPGSSPNWVWYGGQIVDGCSATQNPSRPGCPTAPNSSLEPAATAHARLTSAANRPSVAFDRVAVPSAFAPCASPNRVAHEPLAITRIAAPPVVTATPFR